MKSISPTLVMLICFAATPTNGLAAQTTDGPKYNLVCADLGPSVVCAARPFVGFAYGSTDEVGWKAVENPVPWHDFHATVLHLLGLDHERLTFYHNGIKRRLTNVHGHVICGILA